MMAHGCCEFGEGAMFNPPNRSKADWSETLCDSAPSPARQATMLFAELTYTLATEEAERIGVDHVARMTATGTGENSTGRGCHYLRVPFLLQLLPCVSASPAY